MWSFDPEFFRLYYCTGWKETLLHYRRMVDGEPIQASLCRCVLCLEQIMVNKRRRTDSCHGHARYIYLVCSTAIENVHSFIWSPWGVIDALLCSTLLNCICFAWRQNGLWYVLLPFQKVLFLPFSSTAQDWQAVMMVSTPSRGSDGGGWKLAALVPVSDKESLDVYFESPAVRDTKGNLVKEAEFDRPSRGDLPYYHVPCAGSFKLQRGSLLPFPRGNDQRFMLVSDIDGGCRQRIGVIIALIKKLSVCNQGKLLPAESGFDGLFRHTQGLENGC